LATSTRISANRNWVTEKRNSPDATSFRAAIPAGIGASPCGAVSGGLSEGFWRTGGLLFARFRGGYGHRGWGMGQAARPKIWNLRNSYPEHLTPGLRRHVPTSPAEVDRTPARTARLCDKALVRLGSDRPLGPGTGCCRNGCRGSGRGRGGRRGRPVWVGGALRPCSSSWCRLRRRPRCPLR